MKIIKRAKTLRSSVINIQHEKAREKVLKKLLAAKHEASSTSSGEEHLCAFLPCQQPILSYVFCAFQLHMLLYSGPNIQDRKVNSYGHTNLGIRVASKT